MECRCRKPEAPKPQAAPSIVIVGTPPPAPGWPARASAPKATHTDVALTSLFNAHIALLNYERTTIWQRYAISLAGNALLVGFMGEKAPLVIGAIVVLGIILTTLSILMLERGYAIFYDRLDQAARFKWQTEQNINPTAAPHRPDLSEEETRRRIRRLRNRDRIKWCAQGILVGFLALYGFIGITAINNPQWLRKAQCDSATGQPTR